MKRTASKANEGGTFLLGIEGGATRTTVLGVDGGGKVVAEFQTGPANVRLLTDKKLAELLRGIAGQLPGRPGGIGIGLAGVRGEAEVVRVRTAVARQWPGVPCLATNDLETALAAGKPAGKPAARVLVLSGTGSCCFGRAADGRTAKVGGRGHVIGDRGSACDIGQRALKALMAHFDHAAEWPRLGAEILRELQLNDAEDLIPWSMMAAKDEIARVAVAVFAAARQKDPMALDLLELAAASLVEDGIACASRLSAKGEKVEFVLSGGVLMKQPAFARQVAARLKARWPGARVAPLERPSVWGAVELARGLGVSLPGPAVAVVEAVQEVKALAAAPTEQRNPRSMKLDTMPLKKAVLLMLGEEALLPPALAREAAGLVWVVEKIIAAFEKGGRLIYAGAGTSGRLGVLDASECPPTFSSPADQVQGIIAGGRTALWSPVEGAEDDREAGAAAVAFRRVTARDVVVGIAASGRTPFVWGALEEAKRRGAVAVLVCFNPAFKKDGRVDRVIAPDIGPEVLTGSTRLKAGTATKQILNIFTTLAMARTGKVISNLMVDVNPSNVKLRDRAVRIVHQLTGWDEETARAALVRNGWVVKEAVKGKG